MSGHYQSNFIDHASLCFNSFRLMELGTWYALILQLSSQLKTTVSEITSTFGIVNINNIKYCY